MSSAATRATSAPVSSVVSSMTFSFPRAVPRRGARGSQQGNSDAESRARGNRTGPLGQAPGARLLSGSAAPSIAGVSGHPTQFSPWQDVATRQGRLLLCLVKACFGWHGWSLSGLRSGFPPGLLGAGLGMGRSRWSGKLWSRPAGQVRPGTADESFEGQRVRGSRLSGQAVPGALGVRRRAEVAVDLASGVTLQAADDLRLGLSFGRAALGVGAGGRVGAEPGEHDPP